MPKIKENYLQLCKGFNIVPQDVIINALIQGSERGELDLSGKTETSLGWEVLGKVIASSEDIRTLIFRDCLIPPRGLSALLDCLCQCPSVYSLDLRGNNIQSGSVPLLGKLLRHTHSLKKLCLEWNSIGANPDSFGLFCDGLALNQTLEHLDLKNNQISSDSAPHLSDALRKNTALRQLDLRWNSLGFKGGQHILSAMEANRVVHRIRVQGNCMPDELAKSIEQIARHNEEQEKLKKSCKQETEFLAQHLKESEESREIIKKESRGKIQEVVKESESRIGQLEAMLSERAAKITALQHEVESCRRDLQSGEGKIHALQETVRKKDELYSELTVSKQREFKEIEKKLADKDLEMAALKTRHEAELLAERGLLTAAENKLSAQAKEARALEKEVQQNAEKLRLCRHENEETLLAEHALNQELLLKAERECDAKLSKLKSEMSHTRSSLLDRCKELEKENEAVERKKAELSSLLAREQARADEASALALQQARAREEARAGQLEDKLALAREQTASLEKQLSVVHSAMTQLQQHNAALMAEMAEPQRKLGLAHEELASERAAIQRVRQELADEAARAASKLREVESLRDQLRDSQAKVAALTAAQTDHEKAKSAQAEEWRAAMAERDRELQLIRQDEAERAAALYSAVRKYLGGLPPTAVSSRTSLPM